MQVGTAEVPGSAAGKEPKKLRSNPKTQTKNLKNLEDVISCAGGPVFSVDKNYCYTSFNRQHAKTMKALYGAVIKVGNSLLDYHSNSQDRKLAKKYLDRALKGETVLVESFAGEETKSRRYFEIAHYPLIDHNKKVKGVTVYARDITNLKNREEENKQIARTVMTLSNSNQAMMHATNESEYMQEVCRNIEKDCGYAMVWIGLAENDKNKSVRPVISAGFEDGYLENARISWADNDRGRGPTGTAIRTGKVSLCRNMLTDPKFKPWRNDALKHGYASSIALPLIAGDKPFGALTIYSKLPDGFAGDEVKVLSELANDLAYGITAFKLRLEQEKAGAALKASEENYRLLLKYAPTAIYELDYFGPRFKSVNDAMCQMSGYSREELLATSPFNLLDDESKKRFQERIASIAAGKPVDENVEYGVIVKGGDKVWATLNIKLSYENGKNVGALVVAHNVTERRKMEEALRNANSLLETVTEGTRVIISTMDTDYRYTYFTQSYKEDIARLSGREIQIGTSMIETFAASPEQQELAVKQWDRPLQGISTEGIVEFGDPGRYRRIYSVRRTPIRNADGIVIGAGEVASDITEQENAKKALVESENRFQSLFDRMTEGFALHEIICDENNNPCDYRFLDVNPAFEQLTGLKRENIVGRTHNEVIPNDSPKWVEVYGRVALTGEPIHFENYSPALDRHYAVNSFRPEPGKFAVIFQDITARKNADEKQNWLASFPENNPTPVVEVDFAGVIHYLNPSARLAFPDLSAKGKGHPYLEGLENLIEHFKVENAEPVIRDVYIHEKYYRQTISCISAVNRLRFYCVDISARVKAEEELRQARDELEGRVKDRTKELVSANEMLQAEARERKRVEFALRESEDRYRTLFETSPDALMLVDMNNKIIFANQRAASMHGYRNPKTLAGKDVSTLIAPKDLERVRQDMSKTAARGDLTEIEYLILKKDGIQFPGELNVSVVKSNDGLPSGYLLDVRDITERKYAEEALQSAYAYNRSLIEASLDPLVTITLEGKIGDVNKATELITGFSRDELIGTDFHNYFTDPVKARAGYQEVFKAGIVRDYNLEIRHKDGRLTPVVYNSSVYRDETGNVKGAFAAARDITERTQFETQLVQAEKHAVIGRMVGSITHEINNPLQTIKNCLYLLQQDVTPESPLQEPLEMATSETLRLTNLVGHLRELYRPKVGINKQSNEILDILEEVHSLLIPHLNSARVQWQPLTGLQRIYMDCVRDQILEVFLNISMNAIEAMQGNGGTLFVDMVRSEDQVGVIIKDTGPGIPEEIAQHIFEPFMTTKASGLGLGLSISYGIVQRHGGQITLENHPGQGATFTIWLPQQIVHRMMRR